MISTVQRYWGMMDRAMRLPAIFALAFQGVNGLIQLSGYFRLEGSAYLKFADAFIVGNIVGIFLVLNFENRILSGGFSRSVRRHLLGAWAVGLAAAALAVVQGSSSPSFVVFACWIVCMRLMLAWANFNHPTPVLIVAAVLAVALSVLLGSPSQVLLVCFLAVPLAAPALFARVPPADSGFRAVGVQSALAFLKYLPHTISGFALTYLDRFLALNVVPTNIAETYIRTVQVCSWAVFVAFPVVFHLRRQMLKAGVLTPRAAITILLTQTGAMLVTTTIILGVLWRLGRLDDVELIPLITVFVALILSQYYQVVSCLNFVQERFSTINRITLASATTAAAIGIVAVVVFRSAEALATMLLIGWALQSLLTSWTLLPARPAGSAGP